MPLMTAEPLAVSHSDRAELERMARSTSLPHRMVRQAKALLWAADGVANEEVARRSGVDADTVRRWRRRFEEQGVAGVGVIAKGRGRKSWLPEGTVAEVVRITNTLTPPDGSTHWSTRTLGEYLGIGKDSVARIWKDHQLKPWQVKTFKVSNDPNFEEKLVDVVGLYMDPPERAVVFSFDEKTQCQALDRTQPSLPMKPGRAGTMTHDYKRNGTIDLFAAMNIATGEVITDCRKRHTGPTCCPSSSRSTPGPAPLQRPRRARQPLRPHGTRGHRLAGGARPSPLAPALHAHELELAQPGRTLVRAAHRPTAAARRVRQRRRAHQSPPPLGQVLERRPEALHLDQAADEIIKKVQRGRAALHQVKSATDH